MADDPKAPAPMLDLETTGNVPPASPRSSIWLPASPLDTLGPQAAAAPPPERPVEAPVVPPPVPPPIASQTTAVPPPPRARRSPISRDAREELEEFYATDEEAAADGVAHAATGAFGIGILGGKGVGKSYLFQSMVYRTRGRDAGALGYYMAKESIRVYSKLHEGGTGYRLIKTRALVREYEQWERLGTTQRALQTWYRMHIPYNTGWLGRRRSEIAVSFFDGSGDFLSGGAHTEADRQLWNDAFIKASVMIFCVPMWAVLPDRRKLTEDSHWEAREEFLQSFNNVRQEYADLRRKAEASHPVQVIIALTQADSPLCEAEPQSTWITPYLTNPERYLRMLRTSRGVARYLASARAVSSYLYERCESGRDQDASDVVNAEFGGGPPWLVPVTAIDGEELDRVERRGLSLSQRHRLGKPVPAHVELPLLIALVEQCNALA